MDVPSVPPKRRAVGAVIAFVGYLLSPLSWWNDAFINLPIAWLVASGAKLLKPGLYEPVLYAAYWATNALGFVLMHAGVAMNVSKPKPFTWKTLAGQLLVTLAYTALIVILVRAGVLKPLLG